MNEPPLPLRGVWHRDPPSNTRAAGGISRQLLPPLPPSPRDETNKGLMIGTQPPCSPATQTIQVLDLIHVVSVPPACRPASMRARTHSRRPADLTPGPTPQNFLRYAIIHEQHLGIGSIIGNDAALQMRQCQMMRHHVLRRVPFSSAPFSGELFTSTYTYVGARTTSSSARRAKAPAHC